MNTKILKSKKRLNKKISPAKPAIGEYCTFSGSMYRRMKKYMGAKGLLCTQEVTRLSISYLLDKEGF